MVTGKQFYFPMDDRDSFIFLVIVGMRCMWSSTHLVTQLSSCRFTWSSLVPASIESLALSLQCMVQRARRSWNLSSSLVTRAWAWARGAWQRSMHWCTCCIDAWVSSQQLALHRNMRPCFVLFFPPYHQDFVRLGRLPGLTFVGWGYMFLGARLLVLRKPCVPFRTAQSQGGGPCL